MSFPRARIQRFNEAPSCSPAPGTYDPKLDTKVKGPTMRKDSRLLSEGDLASKIPIATVAAFRTMLHTLLNLLEVISMKLKEFVEMRLKIPHIKPGIVEQDMFIQRMLLMKKRKIVSCICTCKAQHTKIAALARDYIPSE